MSNARHTECEVMDGEVGGIVLSVRLSGLGNLHLALTSPVRSDKNVLSMRSPSFTCPHHSITLCMPLDSSRKFSSAVIALCCASNCGVWLFFQFPWPRTTPHPLPINTSGGASLLRRHFLPFAFLSLVLFRRQLQAPPSHPLKYAGPYH